MKTYNCQLYPTILTPFDENGEIDYPSLSRLIGLFSDCGLDGIFAVCQSSEMFFLSDEKKLELADFCIKECRRHGMKCVVSGHTQDEIEDQISYLLKLEKLNPDAVILVNNRLAPADAPESKAIETLDRILSALSPDTRLGIYECPYPYKRFITDELIERMLADGRFDFIKDTCCRSEVIRHRLGMIDGKINLFNANSATLLESICDGAFGYSGIMLNMIPEIFVVLRDALTKHPDPALAERTADVISATSTIEYQNYPANAKFILCQRGIFRTTVTRNGKPPLTESQVKEMVSFLKVTDALLSDLKK